MARFIRTASVVAAALAVLLVAAAMVAMVGAARAPAAGPAAGLSSPAAAQYDFRGARDLGAAAAELAVSVSVPSGIAASGRLGGP